MEIPKQSPQNQKRYKEFSRSLPEAQSSWEVDQVQAKPSRNSVLIIGVAGGSASGKTSVCKCILEQFKTNRVAIISQDSFYKNLNKKELELAEKQEYNFDHPNAFDWGLLENILRDIRDGKPVDVPSYSFVTHQRNSQTSLVVGADVILVEGILIMYHEPIRQLMDMKIFVDEAADVRLSRRILRDIKERGRDLEGVLFQYERHVKPSFEQYIQPTKKWADVIIPRGKENIVAIGLIVQHIQTTLKTPQRSRKAESASMRSTPVKKKLYDDVSQSTTDFESTNLSTEKSRSVGLHNKSSVSIDTTPKIFSLSQVACKNSPENIKFNDEDLSFSLELTDSY